MKASGRSLHVHTRSSPLAQGSFLPLYPPLSSSKPGIPHTTGRIPHDPEQNTYLICNLTLIVKSRVFCHSPGAEMVRRPLFSYVPSFFRCRRTLMLEGRLSLAASSPASEERDVFLRPGVSISAEHGRAHATATSPPGPFPRNESELITRIVLDKGTKSILVIWTWTRRTLRLNKVPLLELWSRCK